MSTPTYLVGLSLGQELDESLLVVNSLGTGVGDVREDTAVCDRMISRHRES